MATIRSYTTINQSKFLADTLQIESADMYYFRQIDNDYFPPDVESICPIPLFKDGKEDFNYDIPCWSLSALLNILHSRQGDIPSLSGGGYKDGKYISDWCLDYEFENGDYQKTFADNPVDVCVAIIEKLHEQKLL